MSLPWHILMRNGERITDLAQRIYLRKSLSEIDEIFPVYFVKLCLGLFFSVTIKHLLTERICETCKHNTSCIGKISCVKSKKDKKKCLKGCHSEWAPRYIFEETGLA